MIGQMGHQKHYNKAHRKHSSRHEKAHPGGNAVGHEYTTELTNEKMNQKNTLESLGESYYQVQRDEAEATTWQEELHAPMSEVNYHRAAPFEAGICDCVRHVGDCLCLYFTNKKTLQPYVKIKIDDTEFQSHDVGDMPEHMCHILYDDLRFQVPYDGPKKDRDLKISVFDVDIGVDRLIGKVYVKLSGDVFDKTDFSTPKYAIHKLNDENNIFGGTVVFSVKIIDKEIEVQIYRLEHIQEALWDAAEDGSEAWKNCVIFIAYILATAGIMGWIEGWTYPEALWFKIITVVGVGYGDFYPTTDEGMLLNTLLICCDVTLLGYTITIILNYILSSAINAKKNKNVSSEKQELYRILLLAAFCFADIVLAVFVFWMFEDWSFIRALHFCVVTLSTVGYGDISPTRTGTKFFCCFYILTIVLSVVKLLSMMVEYIRVQGRKDKVKKAVERGFQLVEIFDEDGDGKITRYEYLKKMLVLGDYVELEEIEQLMVSFDEVDGDQNGVVDIQEIKAKFSIKGHTQYNFTPAVCEEAKEEEDHAFSFNGDEKEEEEDNPLSSNGGEDFSHELKHSKRSAENGPSSPEYYNEPAATDEKGEFNQA